MLQNGISRFRGYPHTCTRVVLLEAAFLQAKFNLWIASDSTQFFKGALRRRICLANHRSRLTPAKPHLYRTGAGIRTPAAAAALQRRLSAACFA